MASRHRWLLLTVFLLIVPGLFWGLPSGVTPQVDAPLPLGPIQFFADYNRPHLNIVYPAFHQLLVLPLYIVAGLVFWLTGNLAGLTTTWPYGFRDVSFFFSVLTVISNTVSAIMAVVLLRLLLNLVPEGERKAWGWAPVLILGTNGVFIYYARVGNFDLPYTFWWGIAVFFLWRYFFGGQSFRRSLLPAAAAAACAAGSKDQAVSFAIGALLSILIWSPPVHSPFRERFRNAFGFGLALVAVYFVIAIAPHPVRWWNHAQFVVSPHAPTELPMSIAGQVQLLGRTLYFFYRTYTIPVVVLGAVGAFAAFRSGRTKEFWILVMPMIAYYVIIIAKTRVVYPRFMLPFAIPLFVFMTYGAAYIGDRVGPRRKLWTAAIGVFVAVQFAISYVPVTYAQVFDTKRALAAELPAYLPPGQDLLVTGMQNQNYPNRDVYERYVLMKMPNEPVAPPSRHAANLFHPFNPEVTHYLEGSGTSGLPWHVPQRMPMIGEKIHEWRYPEWVRAGMLVPVLYEFTLYRKSGPLPVTATLPPPVAPGY